MLNVPVIKFLFYTFELNITGKGLKCYECYGGRRKLTSRHQKGTKALRGMQQIFP